MGLFEVAVVVVSGFEFKLSVTEVVSPKCRVFLEVIEDGESK